MMTADEKTAFLFNNLAEQMGEKAAAALMERLPPDWEQLATKSDLAVLEAGLRGEMSEMQGQMTKLGAELRGEMAELRGQTATLAAGLQGQMTKLAGEMSKLAAGLTTLGAGLTTLGTTQRAEMTAMEGRIKERAAGDLRAILFTFSGFALAVVAMFTTLMIAGVPIAG